MSPRSLYGRIVLWCCALLASCSSSVALADGTRGGGQFVDIAGHPEMRDIVDNCDWIESADWVATLKSYPALMESISKAHWYMAYLLRLQAAKLHVCLTKQELKELPADDGLTIVTQGDKQVAVRFDDVIFLNLPLFKSADDLTQGLTAVHEFMHSLIPMSVPQRNIRLRSMVSAIAQNFASPMDPGHFELQVKMNQLDLHPSAMASAPYQADVLRVLDPSTPTDTAQMLAAQLPQEAIDDLHRADNSDFSKVSDLRTFVSHEISFDAHNGNISGLQKYLSQKPSHEIGVEALKAAFGGVHDIPTDKLAAQTVQTLLSWLGQDGPAAAVAAVNESCNFLTLWQDEDGKIHEEVWPRLLSIPEVANDLDYYQYCGRGGMVADGGPIAALIYTGQEDLAFTVLSKVSDGQLAYNSLYRIISAASYEQRWDLLTAAASKKPSSELPEGYYGKSWSSNPNFYYIATTPADSHGFEYSYTELSYAISRAPLSVIQELVKNKWLEADSVVAKRHKVGTYPYTDTLISAADFAHELKRFDVEKALAESHQ